ncbi:MAG: adenylate kinase [Candidatus Cloacimonetes bacterium HGW-Cloacimonetes-3]|jgi:adenylate kinase|nr:MAG: adenylate kinase [Candidatus Cloacimonetes bacterium HGW-Cloacimonetes-3]
MTDAIVFLGIQGSGKGTQAKILAEKSGYQHVNIGDLFREQIAGGSKLGLEVKSIIARGDLVSDELVFDLVNSSLCADCPGIIFDGFPRTPAQAEFLMANYRVKRVYYLSLSEEDAISRIEARRVCGDCGENFNLISRIPKQEGVCDVCGGQLKQRADDTGDAIKQRVKEFYAQTYALKEFFAKKGVLHTISADNGIQDIGREIMQDLQNL